MTRSRRIIVWLTGFVLMTGALSLAQDEGASSFDLSWHTIDGGGAAVSSAGAFQLGGTIGQPDAGGPMTGGSFELSGGFWPGGATSSIDSCLPDITGDQAINVDDLVAIITGWGPCPPPPTECSADISPPPQGDLQVNVDDLLAVISSWGTCP